MSSFTTLLHNYHPEYIGTGRWDVMRKYNGLGCFWDGGITRGKIANHVPWYFEGNKSGEIATGLWSLGRDGKVKIRHAPYWFLDSLPKGIPLQGELWLNDSIQMVSSIVKRDNPTRDWRQVKFVAFDYKPYSLWELNPAQHRYLSQGMYFENTPWHHRRDLIEDLKINEYLIYPEILCTFDGSFKVPDMLKETMLYSIGQSWEGLVLREHSSKYELKRNKDVLKWKPLHDYEAHVIGYSYGLTGKNVDRISTLQLELTWDDSIESFFGGRKEHTGQTVHFELSNLTEFEVNNIKDIFPIGKEVTIYFSAVTDYGVPSSPRLRSQA